MGAANVFLIATLLVAAVFASPQRKNTVGDTFDVYQNGEKIGSEELKFEKESGLIILEGDDGSFTIQDINKALMVTKYADDAICYLSAMETSPNEGEAVKELIQTSQQSLTTKQVEITTDDITYRTLNGEVKDTSFLPEAAVERCVQGFQWIIQTDVKPTSELRVKRGSNCRTSCSYVYESRCSCHALRCGFNCSF